jgi:hypothetical protein
MDGLQNYFWGFMTCLKDKILGFDGWTTKLFLGFYDFLKRSFYGKGIYGLWKGSWAFNSTFIALIPKKENIQILMNLR